MTIHLLCDFDGTVTQDDNIIALMKRFAPHEWITLKDQVLSREISIEDGVGAMFRLLKSSERETFTRFLIDNASLREGFPEFVRYAEEAGLSLTFVSGGIDFFVHPILAPFTGPERIYCNGSDFSEETIRITWPHACDSQCDNGCGCCKPSISRRLSRPGDLVIAIGDSVTDFELAKQADLVFARDHLIRMCEQEGIRYVPFETFYDIIDGLKFRLEVTK